MAHRYIGRNIYELRKKRGWSQSDLARKLDKKTSTISSYETDSKTPSVDTIIAMSELFGVSIDELIYGENAEVLSTKHLAAEQKRAVADLLQGLTLYNDGNDKDGLARTRLLLQVIKTMIFPIRRAASCRKLSVKIWCCFIRAMFMPKKTQPCRASKRWG